MINNLINARNDFEAINCFLNEYKGSTTYKQYAAVIARFYFFLSDNNTTLKSINVKTVQKFIKFLEKPPENLCGPARSRQNKNWKPFVRPLNSNSIKLNIAIISSLLAYLKNSGYIKFDATKIMRKKNYMSATHKYYNKSFTYKGVLTQPLKSVKSWNHNPAI